MITTTTLNKPFEKKNFISIAKNFKENTRLNDLSIFIMHGISIFLPELLFYKRSLST